MQLHTINYKNFYSSIKHFQETLKWYLGLKSSKRLYCKGETRGEKLHNRGW